MRKHDHLIQIDEQSPKTSFPNEGGHQLETVVERVVVHNAPNSKFSPGVGFRSVLTAQPLQSGSLQRLVFLDVTAVESADHLCKFKTADVILKVTKVLADPLFYVGRHATRAHDGVLNL